MIERRKGREKIIYLNKDMYWHIHDWKRYNEFHLHIQQI